MTFLISLAALVVAILLLGVLRLLKIKHDLDPAALWGHVFFGLYMGPVIVLVLSVPYLLAARSFGLWPYSK